MNRLAYAVAGGVALVLTFGGGHAGAQEPPVDLRRLVAGLDVTERGVTRWLERLGATVPGLPEERLLLVRPTGEDVLERRGGPSSVRVDSEIDDLILRPGMRHVLVHNHPTSVGLSGPDLGQLAKPGVAAVMAVGHDGSVFVASAGRRMQPDFLESKQYVSAKAEIGRRLRAEWPSGSVSVAVSDAHLSHLVSLALAKAGIIDYWFTLRGTGRESFDGARVVFNRVVVGASARLDVAPPISLQPSAAVRLRIVRYPEDAADAASLALAQTVAGGILAPAGVHTHWAETVVAGDASSGDRGEVRILLLPARKTGRPDVSGEVAEDGRTQIPTMLIYMPRLFDLVRTVRTSPGGRSDPRLAGVELGHLLGLTMAHEVGHILGLDHARSGVMKRAPDVGDLLQLRESRLQFHPSEITRLRVGLLARSERRVPGQE